MPIPALPMAISGISDRLDLLDLDLGVTAGHRHRFAGALIDMFPGLHSRIMATVLTLGAIWAVVLINLRGVKEAGFFAELMTYSKLIPFGAVAIIGLFYIDPTHFSTFNASGKPLLSATAALAPLTMFAYLGLESATVPAGDVKNPERTIPRSTILGIIIAMLLCVRDDRGHGDRAARAIGEVGCAVLRCGPDHVGTVGATAISIAVILSSSAPSMAGRFSWARFPWRQRAMVCSRRSSLDFPSKGYRLSGSSSRRCCRRPGFDPGRRSLRFPVFLSLVVGLSTMAAVIPYAFCAMAPALIAGHGARETVPRVTIVEIIAFVFAVFTLYGCGAEAVLYGVVLLVLGIPVYVWQRRRASERRPASKAETARI